MDSLQYLAVTSLHTLLVMLVDVQLLAQVAEQDKSQHK
jgi:hypothetical protein